MSVYVCLYLCVLIASHRSRPPQHVRRSEYKILAQQYMELMPQRRIHPRRIHGCVRVDRIRWHTLVDESRLPLHTTAVSLGIAKSVLTSLIAAVWSGNHSTTAHIGRNAASIETASTITDRLAALAIPHVSVEASAISRRYTHSVVAVISAVWQTTRC